MKSSHRPQRPVVGHPRDPGDQDVGRDDQDDVDEEERADVVGDVAAVSARASSDSRRRILSSEARPRFEGSSTTPSSWARARPRCCRRARRPRCESSPGRCPQQLGGPGGASRDQLTGELRVEAVLAAGVGERLDRERQVGGRAAHHRRRGVEVALGELDDVAEQLQQREQPVTKLVGMPSGGACRARPAAPRPAGSASPGASAPETPGQTRSSDVAASSESSAGAAPPSSAATASSARRLDREDDQDVAALGELGIRADAPRRRPRRPAPRPGPSRVGEQHRLEPARPAAQPRAIAAAMLARADEPDDHGRSLIAGEPRGRR